MPSCYVYSVLNAYFSIGELKMSSFEKEVEIHLAARRQEIADAQYRVELKHSLRKAGIDCNPDLSTEKLEEMCLKYL